MPEYRDTITGPGPLGALDTRDFEASEIEFTGDHDIYLTHLIAGLNYDLDLRGSTAGNWTLSDPYLRLYDAAGALVTFDDDSLDGRSSRINYTATASNYFLEAGAYNNLYTGTYQIRVSEGFGSANADSISGTTFNDAVNALGGNDTVSGNSGNDWLQGDTGNDNLFGGAGNDTVLGGDDFDFVRGGDGNDTVQGGFQSDTLVGGNGSDTFDFDTTQGSNPTSRDSIVAGDGATAFQGAGAAGGDRIDVAGIDANETSGGNQTFIWGGTTKGHLRLVTVGTDTIVQANTDNDAAFEVEIRIADGGISHTTYNAGDFIL